MAHVARSSEPRTLSILDAYGSEVRRLAEAIAGFLDVAERRSDLTSPEDAHSLAGINETLAGLQRRFLAYAVHTDPTRCGVGVPPRTHDVDSASDPSSLTERLVALAAPAVHASVAETLSGKIDSRAEEMRQWFAAPPSTTPRAAHPGAPREVVVSTSSAAQRLEQLLASIHVMVTLQGTTEAKPMDEVFDLLVRLNKTGCLHVRTADEQLSFVFADGIIVATASNNQPTTQFLGEILRQLGLIHRRHIDRLVALARRESKPLGRLMVDEHLLTISQLSKALAIQVEARFVRALAGTDAAYVFVPHAGTRIDDRISVDAAALLAASKSGEAPDGDPETPPTR